MSDSETPPGTAVRQGATPSTMAQRHSAWRGWIDGLLKALWKSKLGNQAGANKGSSLTPSLGGTGSGTWMLIILGILVCVPVGGIVLGYITRPAAGTASISAGGTSPGTSSDSSGKIPKPAPGRPLSSSQAPPSITTSPTPPPIAPVSPAQVSPPQRPVIPMNAPSSPSPVVTQPPLVPAPAKAPFAAVTYPARHDKHFGEMCAGQLTLNSSELVFNCPGNAETEIQVAINQIASVDDNGIRLTSGKKYHFTISGMDKSGERALFADWLSRVR